MRTWIGIGLVGLAGVGACDGQDDVTLEGTYLLSIVETEDDCDGELNSGIQATMTIEREGDTYTVRFGDQATLVGVIDPEGLLQVSGVSNVPVVVDGETVTVTADMVMQIGQFQTGEIEASGRLTFEGTFPGVEETCEQVFVAAGDRRSLAPTLLTGPDR